MEINCFVVHELIKDSRRSSKNGDENDVKMILSTHLAQIDDKVKVLIEEVHKSFTTSSALKHTQFQDRSDKVFKNSIEKYYEHSRDDHFLKFSRDSIIDLKSEISKEPFATGGYYIFCDYIVDYKQYTIVVLLRKKAGINLKFEDNAYVVLTNENLNIDKIAMGFRLNQNIYKNEDSERNYIALITNQQDKLSEYFKEWVVAAGVISDEKNTNALIKIVKNIPLPKDDTGKDKFDREVLKKVCYDYIDQHPDKLVNLKNLSLYLFGEQFESTIINYANSNGITIDNEFKRNSLRLKSLITIKAKVDGIELNVNYNKLNEDWVDVNEKENYIVIKSKELVEQIMRQKNDSPNN